MGQADLPLARAEIHVWAFERCGWVRVRTTSGVNPHIILTKEGSPFTLSIPNHQGKDVKRALLQKQIRTAGLTEDQYLREFHRHQRHRR